MPFESVRTTSSTASSRLRSIRAARGLVLTTLLASASAFSLPSFAQEEPSSSDVAAARALGQEGVKLADAGNCAEAIDKLARAEKLFHAPTTLERLGECQVQVGKIVDGSENLNKVARETLPPNAPSAFVFAQERARKILAEAKPKIAKLKIAVAAPPDAQMSVKVDGEHVPVANLNTNRPIDPGEHVVEVSAPGYKTASGKVTLPEGGSDSIALTLEIDPNAPKVVASPTPATTTEPKGDKATTSEGSSRVPAYAALGLGVVGIGVGTVFGILASGKKSDLETACPNSVCPPGEQDTIDSGKTLGTVSTVGFIVGAVGLVAGTYLFLTSGPKSRAAAPKPTWIGLGGAGINGTF